MGRRAITVAIFCVPCCKISLGIISRPSNDSNFMSSTLCRKKWSGGNRRGEKLRGKVNHSRKDSFGERVFGNIGNNSVKKGKHSSWGDLQVSQSMVGKTKKEGNEKF